MTPRSPSSATTGGGFGPNIYFDGADGAIEQEWVGHEVRIGELRLRIDEPCERCVITTIDPDTIAVDLEVLKRARAELGGMMGVYCTVVDPGPVSVGDPVVVVRRSEAKPSRAAVEAPNL